MRKFCYSLGWSLLALSLICFATIILIPFGIYLFVFGVGLLILTRLESWRYQKRVGRGDGFVPTDEKYIDVESGRRMRVYYNPATGDRDYRPEGPENPESPQA